MDRSAWLDERRQIIERRYDLLWAPDYDENWGEIDPAHQRFVTQLVYALPPDASILDAACGTGKYWPILLASGRKFSAIDQSQQMLNKAKHKYPQVRVDKLSLQDISFHEKFDLILCIDAMEMIFPEDWSRVLSNFYRALKDAGQLYFTVEIADPSVLEQDYRAARAQGMPVVYGESVTPTGPGDDQGGYHFYPSMDQVRKWLADSGFTINEETESADYHHFSVQKLSSHQDDGG